MKVYKRDLILPMVVLACLLSVVTSIEISCRNEEGKAVDWFVNYKLPKMYDEPTDTNLGHGSAYAYVDENGTWVLSEENMESLNSMVGSTMSNYYKNKKKVTYLFYNDAHPNGDTSFSLGHTKGVIVFDQNSGFWLIHSVPKFPPLRSYKYPRTGLMYGQSILCMTFKASELNEIGKQLVQNQPFIYGKKLKRKMSKMLDDDVKALFRGKRISRDTYYASSDEDPSLEEDSEDSEYSRKAILTSQDSNEFVSFAKHRKFGKDLYAELIAPSVETSLATETWRKGRGTYTPPSCDNEFQVLNVKSISIPLMQGTNNFEQEFESTSDHSKWAVSLSDKDPWVCIGDINRMDSQFKRGGGSVCFQSMEAWKAFRSVIKETDDCEDH